MISLVDGTGPHRTVEIHKADEPTPQEIVSAAREYGDLTPLQQAITDRDCQLLDNADLRSLLLDVVTPGAFKLRGRPRSPAVRERNQRLLYLIGYMTGLGFPVWNRDRPCACALAAERCHITPEYAYKEIWRPFNKDRTDPIELNTGYNHGLAAGQAALRLNDDKRPEPEEIDTLAARYDSSVWPRRLATEKDGWVRIYP